MKRGHNIGLFKSGVLMTLSMLMISCASVAINEGNRLMDESNHHAKQAAELSNSKQYEKAVDEYVHAINKVQKADEICSKEKNCIFPSENLTFLSSLYSELAFVQIIMRHYDHAIKNCKTAITYANRPRAHLLLGMAYISKGDSDLAWKEHKALKDMDKEQAKQLAEIIDITEKSYKSLNYLIDQYTKDLKANPKNAAMYNLRGTTYYQIGKYQQALSDLKECIRLDPKGPSASLAQKTIEDIEKATGKKK